MRETLVRKDDEHPKPAGMAGDYLMCPFSDCGIGYRSPEALQAHWANAHSDHSCFHDKRLVWTSKWWMKSPTLMEDLFVTIKMSKYSPKGTPTTWRIYGQQTWHGAMDKYAWEFNTNDRLLPEWNPKKFSYALKCKLKIDRCSRDASRTVFDHRAGDMQIHYTPNNPQ